MKIGIVTEYYYPTLGGIQEHVHHFAVEAMALGHSVRVVTSRVKDVDDADLPARRVPVTRIGLSVPIYNNGSVARVTFAPGLGRKLEALLDRERFDVVHIHAPLTPTLPILALTRSKTVTVGTVHTNFKGSAFLKLFSRAAQGHLDHLDGLIAVSKTAAAALGRYLKADFRIIPNGIDLSQFSPSIPRRPEFDDGRFNIMWIGRMEPRNGLDRMIKAFSLAAAARSDLRLIVVGDGPLKGVYEQMVPGSLKQAVHFTGFVNSGRPSLYASAGVLCVPAFISSFGITLLEGMATAIPVIASDIDGFRDVMKDGREGMLVDTADARAFCGAILRLAGDRALAREYGARGRASAEGYSWPRVTAAVLDVYREASARRAARQKRALKSPTSRLPGS
jgi:phosphatidylinositol alpha-mannosyltransferase